MRLDHRRAGSTVGDETISFDLLIKGALVFTGEGPTLRADVGVADGRISAVEPHLLTQTAGKVLDAAGLMLCPGFIDLHAPDGASTGVLPGNVLREPLPGC